MFLGKFARRKCLYHQALFNLPTTISTVDKNGFKFNPHYPLNYYYYYIYINIILEEEDNKTYNT